MIITVPNSYIATYDGQLAGQPTTHQYDLPPEKIANLLEQAISIINQFERHTHMPPLSQNLDNCLAHFRRELTQ